MLSGMLDTSRSRRAGVGLAVFALVCVTCLVWPGFAIAASVFPERVWGIPFALVWSVGWILVSLAVVTAYHFASGGEEQA